MQNPEHPNITGTAINYLHICQRKLWFYRHHLEMEHTSEKVDLGKHLHEESYPREKRREWDIDNLIRIDFVDKQGILHDIKYGTSMETAHIMQICYYLYLLKQKGVSKMYIILVYDIEAKRVAKVCKYLRQHLNWIQNSVFEGQLTKAQFARVKSGLADITDPEKDSVIIYQLRDAKWMTKEVMGVDKNPATNLL